MRNPFRARGFSLIELMVVIGIIGVLISIILPTLSGARVAASRVQALANARTTTSSFHAYAEEFQTYPFLKPGQAGPGLDHPPPGDAIMVRWWPEGVVIAVDPHWLLAGIWPGLVSTVAPWREHYATWLSPGRDTELPSMPFENPDGATPEQAISYRYSNSFIARPALWRQGATANPDLLHGVRPSEVAFPSNKALLWDAEIAYVRKAPPVVGGHYQTRTAVAFADGHADLHDPTAATPAAPNPMKDAEQVMTLHDTPDGVLGRDY